MTVQVLLTELETARESLERAVACLVPEAKHANSVAQISGKPETRKSSIKVVTDNGFSIERVCEGNECFTNPANGCHFVVLGPDDEERRVTVVFSETAIQCVQKQRLDPLPFNSPFWLARAERFLVTYLWENNDFPPTKQLIIDQP